jgi:hypothetical protein
VGKGIRTVFKGSLESNVESKGLSITSAKRLAICELNVTKLNGKELKEPLDMVLDSIINKHEGLDQEKP